MLQRSEPYEVLGTVFLTGLFSEPISFLSYFARFDFAFIETSFRVDINTNCMNENDQKLKVIRPVESFEL